MDSLLILSGEHTASCFVRALLKQHSKIFEPMTTNELYMNIDAGWRYNHGVDALPMDVVFDLIRQVADGEYDYGALNLYIHEEHLLASLLERPFDGKILITIRHPARVMKTVYRRKEQNVPIMGRYKMLLMAIRYCPDAMIIPVDTLDESQDTRMPFMRNLFENFLDVELEASVGQFISDWPRVNTTLDSLSLSAEDVAELRTRIDRSDVYRSIKDAGVSYEPIDIMEL